MVLALLAAFFAIPLVEVALFVIVGREIGALPTVGLCVLSAVAGTLLVRSQGLGLLMRARSDLGRGIIPAGAVAEGAAIVLAGLLLITPGFFTDTLGFLLLIPPVRRFVIARLARRAASRFGAQMQRSPVFDTGDDGTIDGEAHEVHPNAKGLNSPWQR